MFFHIFAILITSTANVTYFRSHLIPHLWECLAAGLALLPLPAGPHLARGAIGIDPRVRELDGRAAGLVERRGEDTLIPNPGRPRVRGSLGGR